jgi:hypothetical protein
MLVAFGCVILCISLLALIAPVLQQSYDRGQIELQQRLLLIKLRLVRKYYPQLHELTYTEIMEQYDVEALYDDIGRSRYTTIRG